MAGKKSMAGTHGGSMPGKPTKASHGGMKTAKKKGGKKSSGFQKY